MGRYRVRLIGEAEMSATIRRRRGKHWVATILPEEGKHIGGFGYPPVTVLSGDLAGKTARGRVARSLGKGLRIKGVRPFVGSDI